MGHSSESGETSATDTGDNVDYTDAKGYDSSAFVKVVVSDSEDDSSPTKKQHTCHYPGCNKEFSRPWRLAAHLSTHTGELPYKCSFDGCDKAYTTNSHLRRHIANTHQRKELEILFRCPFPGCEAKMKSQWNINKHFKSKHEPKAFKCTVCVESFRKHSQLKAHMYEHTGVPPIQCTICNAGFLKIGDLNRHMRCHKQHTCSNGECRQVFETWTQLRKHVALEHPKEYVCDHCGRVFYNKTRLRSHVMVHQDPSEREVIYCPYNNCGRYYFEKKNLDHHIHACHDKKNYPCLHPGCGRQLSSQTTLRAHLKLHNPKGPMPTKRKRPRKKRCDVGRHKRSMAVKLSGLRLEFSEERDLVEGRLLTCELNAPATSDNIPTCNS
ncbi:transcription factor IIIA-like [Schistocerca piceifrons]|uniref:transcription factor IIIA-like n=1 Tax=Schistocerca piceifrons TaxID=274613 RepID=UPI001F5EEB38|nr:transcription factor IIIA-like [Schistocerca piceifrons]XP_047110807.1 transcription factor IIIA-like [Schistocerca piceifrons]XP_047110808.1 transcription factor IIIA-like [Schistocerca piceifrons]